MGVHRLNGKPCLVIEDPEDILGLFDLDIGHWAASSIPSIGVTLSHRLLGCLDVSGDGLITSKELIGLLRWLEQRVDDWSFLFGEAICLHKVSVEGLKLNEALSAIGLASRPSTEWRPVLEATLSDGVVANRLPLEQIDEGLSSFAHKLLMLIGEDGNSISAEQIEDSLSALSSYQAWLETRPEVEYTELCHKYSSELVEVAPLIEGYFRASILKGEHHTELAAVQDEGLPLQEWLVPSHRDLCRAMRTQLDCELIRLSDWASLFHQAKIWQEWVLACPAPRDVVFNPEQRLECEHFAGLLHQELILHSQHFALRPIYEELLLLLDCSTELVPLLNCSVNFMELYNPSSRSIPELGSVLFGGCWYHLVLSVQDIERHKAVAEHSGFRLGYISLVAQAETFAFVAFGQGELSNGLRGLFIDRNNAQHVCEIIDLIDGPTTISQGLVQPITSFFEVVVERINGFRQRQEVLLHEGLSGESPAPSISREMWIGGGFTFAAVSSSFAYLLQTLADIRWQQIAGIVLVPLALVCLISAFVTAWKLLNRDLAPLLRASGWGVNHRLITPLWVERVFTKVPTWQTSLPAPEILHQYHRKTAPKLWYARLFFWIVLLCGVLGFWWWSANRFA